MSTTWLQSPYYTAGRQGAKITDIVLHWMAGTLASTDAEFTGGTRRVSAHYGIEDGVVHQYVDDADTAWHAGNWGENLRSIGIEHSATPTRPASPETIATSVALIIALCHRFGIDPSNIYPHNKFFPTACPGTLPLAEIVARVRVALSEPAAPIPPVPAAPPVSTRNIAMVKAIQTAVRVTVDGAWGDETSRAGTAVIRRVLTFVKYLQARVGTVVDGVWGPRSEAARIATVKQIQSAINVTPDGLWGPLSQAAWNRAYAANFKKY